MKQSIKIKTIKVVLFVFILFASGIIEAQMGIGIANPAPSAQLDVSSTSKGFLPPRMTQAQRNAIVNPAPGLMIWCKDCGVTGEIQVYNGIAWKNLAGGDVTAALPKSVTIGTQEWMTKNLDVVTYRNGDTIPEVTDSAEWINLTTGAWCYYNNDPALGAIFGKLYNWPAINDPRGLAPTGWHIPYETYVGGEWNTLLHNFSSGEDAAIKMKASILWISSGTVPTNSTGFTALPGGYRDVDGKFHGLGNYARWWGLESGYMYNFSYIFGGAMNGGFFVDMIAEIYPVYDEDAGEWQTGPVPKMGALSVRCIKD